MVFKKEFLWGWDLRCISVLNMLLWETSKGLSIADVMMVKA